MRRNRMTTVDAAETLAAYEEWNDLPKPTLTEWMNERFPDKRTDAGATWAGRVKSAQAAMYEVERVKEWQAARLAERERKE